MSLDKPTEEEIKELSQLAIDLAKPRNAYVLYRFKSMMDESLQEIEKKRKPKKSKVNK